MGNITEEEVFKRLNTSRRGLSSEEALNRLNIGGASLARGGKKLNLVMLLLSQFKSPLIFLLLFASVLSFFLKDEVEGSIILGILLISGLLSFFQEKGALEAVQKLFEIVQITASAMRDGIIREIPLEQVVPGDVILLKAGDVVPGDCLLFETKDLFVDEAALTGEMFAVEKHEGNVSMELPPAKRTNTIFMGTHVVSGSARAVVINTGKSTLFGKIYEQLKHRSSETAFERGMRKFGYLLLEITLILTILIIVFNSILHQPTLSIFMFAFAIAVGLTPQLLPAIVTINLSRGAKRLAAKKVIVKKLASIENLGNMQILCVDKTGTITSGTVRLYKSIGVDEKESNKVHTYAYINASLHGGYKNQIDYGILEKPPVDHVGWLKIDELPYDFTRKRNTVLVKNASKTLMITKGAVKQMLSICNYVEAANGEVVSLNDKSRHTINEYLQRYSDQGFRAIAVAYREKGIENSISIGDEKDMVLLGLILFFDPLKEDAKVTISQLEHQNVNLKIITGDNRFAAKHIALALGFTQNEVVIGEEISAMSEQALIWHVTQKSVFAEVEPSQKERIILALRKAGYVVGFLGDGVNDAPALKAADVGISVDRAVDIAKEVADIVLLSKELSILSEGIREGRRTFANTLKYIFMATSANFGNMFSMAGASLFLPFFPLLPKQVLLTNLLTDFPEMAIATDHVDEDWLSKPIQWDLQFIRRFMIVFGLISSFFDFLTFGILMFIFKSSPEQFRTAWFVESVISACCIVLVVRTHRLFFKSLPSKQLTLCIFLIVILVLALPFTGIAPLFNFVVLGHSFYVALLLIVTSYILLVELAKIWFYGRFNKKLISR